MVDPGRLKGAADFERICLLCLFLQQRTPWTGERNGGS